MTTKPTKRRNPQDANVSKVARARQNTEARLLARIRKLEAPPFPNAKELERFALEVAGHAFAIGQCLLRNDKIKAEESVGSLGGSIATFNARRGAKNRWWDKKDDPQANIRAALALAGVPPKRKAAKRR